jgi:hypothetical protein
MLLAGAPGSSQLHTESANIERRYVLNARVRPFLLFWIGRENVGDATIKWATSADGQLTIELLVGADPDRAPRQINRWGYIREAVSKGHTDVIGLMTASGEQTLGEAEAEVEKRRSSGGTVFNGLQTIVSSDYALTSTATFAMQSRVTYRQLDFVLRALREKPAAPRRFERPPGAEPGFLFAMTALIQRSLLPCRTSPGSRVPIAPVPYFYKQSLYNASLLSCSFVPVVHTNVATYNEVIDARFKVKNRRTGDETPFRIVYGASGESAGRPVRIVFRPRWWMEAELLWDGTTPGPAAVSR